MRRLLLGIAAAGLLAPAAASGSATALIRDCLQNGRITGHYSSQDYSQALANLPTDVQEYSDCADVIRRAQLASASGQPTASGPANPRQNPLSTAAPAERRAVALAQHGGSGPLQVGGGVIRPGVVRTSSLWGSLPTPLVIAIAALIALALAATARWGLMSVRARRSR